MNLSQILDTSALNISQINAGDQSYDPDNQGNSVGARTNSFIGSNGNN